MTINIKLMAANPLSTARATARGSTRKSIVRPSSGNATKFSAREKDFYIGRREASEGPHKALISCASLPPKLPEPASDPMVSFLKEQVRSLQQELAHANDKTLSAVTQALERANGQAQERLLVVTQELSDLRTSQAVSGANFLLRNRVTSARGAIEWAEDEISRLRFLGRAATRKEKWHFVTEHRKEFRDCLAAAGWPAREVPSRIVALYERCSKHIHDKPTPQFTARRPVVLIEQEPGTDALTTDEVTVLACICKFFRLSYDIERYDEDTGAKVGVETFRALDDSVLESLYDVFCAESERAAEESKSRSSERDGPRTNLQPKKKDKQPKRNR